MVWHLRDWEAPSRRQSNHFLRECGKAMLGFDTKHSSLPLLSDFVQHGRNHAEQDIDRPAVGRDRILNNPGSRLKVLWRPASNNAWNSSPRKFARSTTFF